MSEIKGTKKYNKVFKSTIVELHKKGESIAEYRKLDKTNKKRGKLEGEDISYKELLEPRKR